MDFDVGVTKATRWSEKCPQGEAVGIDGIARFHDIDSHNSHSTPVGSSKAIGSRLHVYLHKFKANDKAPDQYSRLTLDVRGSERLALCQTDPSDLVWLRLANLHHHSRSLSWPTQEAQVLSHHSSSIITKQNFAFFYLIFLNVLAEEND
ncbi:hypothetical protein D917_09221 [Trichinella nativa]|uniref:Uncharacterized protein n=1 Tax=Trichinella nativa TaxID=6335 RepID=A0A1Y3EKH7_9BILA|nr:hypothetical protein D917_09221 [Trichinella nativa]